MGLGRLTVGFAFLTLAACGAGGAPHAPATEPAPAAGGATGDPVARALDVWERGAEGIPLPARPSAPTDVDPEPVPEPEEEAPVEAEVVGPAVPFREFDSRTRAFLVSPDVVDAVQFSCVPQYSADETWVQAGLDDPDPEVRLRALVVLVRVRAPRSVDRQWAALCALGDGLRAAEFRPVTVRLRDAFAPEALDRTLAEPPPGTEYSTPPAYQWALRAAGVTRHRGALDRLVELSRDEFLDVSLSAERSLQDFEGPEGDAALAGCVSGWRYNAAMRAANALLERDRERLRRTLLDSTPPAGLAYWKGVYLARLGDRRGVPILCAEVPGPRIIDREMFDGIERLAGPEDLPDVESLTTRVREDQASRASEVVASVRERLGTAR